MANENVSKMCEMIISQYGEKGTWGMLALHCLGRKQINFAKLSETSLRKLIEEGLFLFKGTPIMDELQNELNRRKAEKVQPKAELDKEVLTAIANETWQSIKFLCGIELLCCWGVRCQQQYALVGDNGYYRYGVRFSVNGGFTKER